MLQHATKKFCLDPSVTGDHFPLQITTTTSTIIVHLALPVAKFCLRCFVFINSVYIKYIYFYKDKSF